MLIIQIRMTKALVLLALIALTCSMHLQNLEHSLASLTSEHEVAIPVTHEADPDYTAIRNSYLGSLPPGPTVDGGKATNIRDFFGTPMGQVILNYFNSLSTQANGQSGLNLYNLSDPNFRLWLAIKILAGPDTNLYARSLAADYNLFVELVNKSNRK